MTTTATYTFTEAIERISQCTEHWELLLLSQVLDEECCSYSLFHWKLISEAVKIMKDVVVR